jgi:hypothetical protein
MTRLKADEWRVIRQIWEFDPDGVTYAEAASRAGERHGFKPPSKAAISKRAKAERWERRGSMDGIDAAAHLRADKLVTQTERKPGVQGGGTGYNDIDAQPDTAAAEYEERREAEIRRAEIRARHRQEWQQIAVLRQEALKFRDSDLDQAFHRAKLAKISAESLSIQ